MTRRMNVPDLILGIASKIAASCFPLVERRLEILNWRAYLWAGIGWDGVSRNAGCNNFPAWAYCDSSAQAEHAAVILFVQVLLIIIQMLTAGSG